jgi:hypothetical protein
MRQVANGRTEKMSTMIDQATYIVSANTACGSISGYRALVRFLLEARRDDLGMDQNGLAGVSAFIHRVDPTYRFNIRAIGRVRI